MSKMSKMLCRQKGFTLIEAIVALAVLLIGALATCSAFVVGSRFNAHSEDRTIAANIAQLKMEEIKNTYYLFTPYCFSISDLEVIVNFNENPRMYFG